MTTATALVPHPGERVFSDADADLAALETLKRERARVPSLIARSTNATLALDRLVVTLRDPVVASSPFVVAHSAEFENVVEKATTAIVGDQQDAAEIVRIAREVRAKTDAGIPEVKALGILWLALAVPGLLGASLWGWLSYQETRRITEKSRQIEAQRDIAALRLKAIQEGAGDAVVRSLASLEDALLGKGATLSLAVAAGASIGLFALLFLRPKRGAGS